MRPLLVADLFCGAGGSSTGAKKAIEQIGRRMVLTCVNHWDRAIETHTRMHPEARHHCMDVASARPIELVPEGRLDLLMASPTCTYHSRARGGRPTSDQQRMDPWHVVTWLTELDVRRLLIENVPEFVDWGPVDPRTGRPLKSRKGQYFREWIATLERLGYRVEWKVLNCADYGDATTRRRFFLLGRKRGRIKWPEPTHAKEPGHDLLAPRQRWRSARECIDWNLRGASIFGRKVPLAPRTIQRIYAGAVRFGWPEPYLLALRNHMSARVIELPLLVGSSRGTPAVPPRPAKRLSDERHLLRVDDDGPVWVDGNLNPAQPIVVGSGGATYAGKPRTVDQPLTTVLTQDRRGVAEPLLIRSDSHGARKIKARSPDEPLQTIVGSGGIAIAEPFVVSATHHGGFRGHGLDAPMPTVTGANRGENALIEPFLIGQHFDRKERSLKEPMPAATTISRVGLAEPFVLSQASGGAPRDVGEPIPTATTGGKGGSHALITAYYGANAGCKPIDQPLDTVTTLDRFGMVVPVTHGGGGPVAREMGNPLPTLTTSKGGHLAFITASFGERDGQLPRVHDLGMPVPTIPAQGSVRMAQAGLTPDVTTEGAPRYDILFRMLHWKELARAMSFSDAESQYDFAGTKTEITKQIGNAVPVNMAKALVAASLYDVEV